MGQVYQWAKGVQGEENEGERTPETAKDNWRSS